MNELTHQEIYTEAQIIYDGVVDSAMESGREMPWWSELPEEVMNTYIQRAIGRLTRRRETFAALEKLNESDVVSWLEDKGYDVAKYE